jgi:hypothetical protein
VLFDPPISTTAAQLGRIRYASIYQTLSQRFQLISFAVSDTVFSRSSSTRSRSRSKRNARKSRSAHDFSVLSRAHAGPTTADRETILKDRQTNRLLMELREERVQRLQDLEEIYAKDRRLEALAAEVVSLQHHQLLGAGCDQY